MDAEGGGRRSADPPFSRGGVQGVVRHRDVPALQPASIQSWVSKHCTVSNDVWGAQDPGLEHVAWTHGRFIRRHEPLQGLLRAAVSPQPRCVNALTCKKSGSKSTEGAHLTFGMLKIQYVAH